MNTRKTLSPKERLTLIEKEIDGIYGICATMATRESNLNIRRLAQRVMRFIEAYRSTPPTTEEPPPSHHA